jgi:hypothetical protein
MKHDPVYCGETAAKRDSRVRLYHTVNTLLPAQVRESAVAVVLAGPRSCEVEPLRDHLRFPTQNVIFAEHSEKYVEGLRYVQRSWPGVNVHFGEAVDAFKSQPKPLAFMNLDAMGGLKDLERKTIRVAADRATPGAVIAYTFIRGREDYEHQARKMLDMYGAHDWRPLRLPNGKKRSVPLSERISKDRLRVRAYALEIQKELRNPYWELVFLDRYQSQSPMAVLAFQYAPPQIRTTHWTNLVKNLRENT